MKLNGVKRSSNILVEKRSFSAADTGAMEWDSAMRKYSKKGAPGSGGAYSRGKEGREVPYNTQFAEQNPLGSKNTGGRGSGGSYSRRKVIVKVG